MARPKGKGRKLARELAKKPKPDAGLEIMGAFKDEDIMFIWPGSHTTVGQLGITETKSPPTLRVKSRMFPGEKPDEWEPYKVYERKATKKVPKGVEGNVGEDTVMGGTEDVQNRELNEPEYSEDRDTDEGAVWPLQSGRIVNWSCFAALLLHVHNILSPTLKSPVVIVTQPAFTPHEREEIGKLTFQKFQTIGMVLLDATTVAQMAFNIGDPDDSGFGVVVDVGYDKCDVTAVVNRVLVEPGREISLPDCGGNTMTKTLLGLLDSKGFNYDMCEQLKRSGICEILPPNTPLPTVTKAPRETNPAAAASAGANTFTPKVGTEGRDDKLEDDEGVLDVASIVASGKASEILAKKEKEKADKAAAKKGKASAANEAKAVKIPNLQKAFATFQYSEPRAQHGLNGDNSTVNGQVGELTAGTTGDGKSKEESRRSDKLSATVRKEIEVGVERFQADGKDHELLHKIADAIRRVINSVPLEYRAAMWDNIMIVGNGSRIRGFKESLMALLHSKYLVTPQSGTIFTSELPSDFSTPIPTGANTPNPQVPGAGGLGHHGPGVNPLLVAATHASNPSLAPPGQQQYQQFVGTTSQNRSGNTRRDQVPTSIKLAESLAERLAEWKEYGVEDSPHWGTMMVAHSIFGYDVGPNGEKAYVVRNDYNNEGPPCFARAYM